MYKIIKKIKHSITGEVLDDDVSQVLYSKDASIFCYKPLAIIRPKNFNDISKVIKLLADENISIHARGAGTAMTGGSLGSGVIIDYTKYLNNILKIDPENNSVRVEPGVIYGHINKALAKYNKFFPPDPSSGDYCTIGGMIANNSAGPHSLKYKSTNYYIEELVVALPTGKIYSTNNSEIAENLYNELNNLPNFKNPREKIESIKNVSGLNICSKDKKIDLNQLFCGSEGILGQVLEAKIRISNLPKHQVLAVAVFSDLKDCLNSISKIREFSPSLIELMDDLILDPVRAEVKFVAEFLPEKAKSLLLIEFDENNLDEIKTKITKLEQELKSFGVIKFQWAKEQKERDELWKIRKSSSPILFRAQGSIVAVRCIEDVCVPIEKIPEFYLQQKKILNKYKLSASFYGHVGSGHFHLNPKIDVSKPELTELLSSLMEETYDLVISLDGTISGEHGDGLIRAPFVKKLYPKSYNIFKKVKNFFDPNNIFNPHKILSDDPEIHLKNLRYTRSPKKTDSKLDDKNYFLEIEKCHGCGQCRTFCPAFPALISEIGTSRGKATLLSAFTYGEITDLVKLKKALDFCFNCGRCKVECPTNIDIPALVIKFKELYHDKKGVHIYEKNFYDTEKLAKLARKHGTIVSPFINNKFLRTILEPVTGIHRSRKLPLPGGKINISPPGGDGARVVYFPGCFATYYNPEGELQSTLEVLNKNSILVKMPEFNCCGIASISAGLFKQCENDIKENTKKFDKFIKNGFKIITSSASCGLALNEQSKNPNILDKTPYLSSRAKPRDPFNSAQGKSFKILDIHIFLLNLHKENKLNTNFKQSNLKIAFHVPCHLKLMGLADAPIKLLKLIPGLTIYSLPDQCCGIGGTFGMKKQNYDLSMKIGQPLFDAINNLDIDYVVTSCGTCKIQLEQGTEKKVVHTMEIIKQSY